ncbi:orotidine-5'-phosphate decarboxylase [Fundicoccus sp. Sow4_D5]|uniref:orotidine-5'-phosphate decarboxylase n=1 Tax=Fundicoccus sp. Sow4_D5 TaxID=3438782 RepID=UPI003F92B4E6
MDSKLPIIALDFATVNELHEFLTLFPTGETLNLKVGMEMYYMNGPELVRELVAAGHKLFLDLKLHDIPNTVKRSMSILAQLGVSMVNVHAMGGSSMLEAAKEGLVAGTPAGAETPLLIAVTQLTSTTEAQVLNEQLSRVSLNESVSQYAKTTAAAGLDGVVCSPLEAAQIKAALGKNFLTVTPGIRLASNEVTQDDQYRIATPEKAAAIGSDYIVVGRPITRAQKPLETYRQLTQAWQAAKTKGEA